MREWLKKHGGYWTFGIFLLALLGSMGGLGIWGLEAQDEKRVISDEKIAEVAAAENKRVEEKTEAEIKRLDTRADTNLELIGQMNAKLDRMDGKLDMLLMRVSATTSE